MSGDNDRSTTRVRSNMKVENRINGGAMRRRVAAATAAMFRLSEPVFDSTGAAGCVMISSAPGQGVGISSRSHFDPEGR